MSRDTDEPEDVQTVEKVIDLMAVLVASLKRKKAAELASAPPTAAPREPIEAHRYRRTKFYQPLLGPCICRYCEALPYHEERSGTAAPTEEEE